MQLDSGELEMSYVGDDMHPKIFSQTLLVHVGYLKRSSLTGICTALLLFHNLTTMPSIYVQ